MNRMTQQMRDRRQAEVHKRLEKNPEYAKGILTMYDLLTEWDHYVDHDFCLSDAMLMKLNLLPKRLVRKNVRRTPKYPVKRKP